MKRLIEKLVLLAVKWCEKRNRVFYITGGDQNQDVYLIRYILFKSKRFGCIYIHRFMRSDSDVPHDHPWNFYTYIVSGEYTEKFYNRNRTIQLENKFESLWVQETNVRKAGSIAYRKATDIHQVVLDKTYVLDIEAPLTICLMSKRLREWGFWEDSATFLDWRKYLDIVPGDARIEGGE